MINYIKENSKLFKICLTSIIIMIVILSVILVIVTKKETSLDIFNNTVLATIENVKMLSFDENYKLINFPDSENIISSSGKVKLSTGKLYDEFKYGYIIIYQDGQYSFKLSDGLYCAIKNYTSDTVEIDISGECQDYEIIYK